jgi:hypothetical protein
MIAMYWHRLTKQDFPSPGDVLLWVDCHDGGFPVLAYVEKVGNIIWWWSAGGQSHLDKSQWKQTRWAKIEPPEGVVGM